MLIYPFDPGEMYIEMVKYEMFFISAVKTDDSRTLVVADVTGLNTA